MADATNKSRQRDVADPNDTYELMRELWKRSRAICGGERTAKAYDALLDLLFLRNLLIPFSPQMSPEQYKFYVAEAELPEIVAQYARTIVGGLLRKKPTLTLPTSVPEDAVNWMLEEFGQDGSPMVAFLDEALWEEMQTSRAWIFVDYPKIENPKELTKQDFLKYKPYPTLMPAEAIINWKVETVRGQAKLNRLVVRGYEEDSANPNEFHPNLKETIYVHELVNSVYRIRKFQPDTVSSSGVASVAGVGTGSGVGTSGVGTAVSNGVVRFKEVEVIDSVMFNGKPLSIIPAWPLNGCIEPITPILTPLVNREIGLYNKISRRNHLLYGASTYTPVIYSDMGDDAFKEVVEGGLGSWIHLGQDDKADVLATPTEALQDMQKAIEAGTEDMAKLGVRMMSPEIEQSGVALDIRNASQTAQLGTLNQKISHTMRSIIAFMLNWRYDLELTVNDVEFELSADFNPTPLGADWLRLATEWYENGLIPRTVWISLLKQNDMIDGDYDDKKAVQEINGDPLIMQVKQKLAAEAAANSMATPPGAT